MHKDVEPFERLRLKTSHEHTIGVIRDMDRQ
jgi:hypothetical protein